MIGPIARKIGSEVAEGLTEKVAPAAKKAVKKAVKTATDKADDWGWKGGKKGEVTGSDWFDKGAYRGPNMTGSDESKVYNKFADQMKKAADSGKLPKNASDPLRYRLYAGVFDELQKADVPRAWTGRVAKAYMSLKPNQIMGLRTGKSTLSQALSDKLRPLTNSQRDTFLSLLPEWEGSLDDLARAARSL